MAPGRAKWRPTSRLAPMAPDLAARAKWRPTSRSRDGAGPRKWRPAAPNGARPRGSRDERANGARPRARAMAPSREWRPTSRSAQRARRANGALSRLARRMAPTCAARAKCAYLRGSREMVPRRGRAPNGARPRGSRKWHPAGQMAPGRTIWRGPAPTRRPAPNLRPSPGPSPGRLSAAPGARAGGMSESPRTGRVPPSRRATGLGVATDRSGGTAWRGDERGWRGTAAGRPIRDRAGDPSPQTDSTCGHSAGVFGSFLGRDTRISVRWDHGPPGERR